MAENDKYVYFVLFQQSQSKDSAMSDQMFAAEDKLWVNHGNIIITANGHITQYQCMSRANVEDQLDKE